MTLRSVLPVAALSVLLGGILAVCFVPWQDPAEQFEAAKHDEENGRERWAYWQYRQAARRGNLDSQVRLSRRGDFAPDVVIAGVAFGSLPTSRPTSHETLYWHQQALGVATRLANAGDLGGHSALGLLLATGPSPVDPDTLALARHHMVIAAGGGRVQAAGNLAVLVWETEGPLASEPYIRRALAAGADPSDDRQLNSRLYDIVLHRPRLAKGHPASPDIRDYDAIAEVRMVWADALDGDVLAPKRFYERVRMLQRASESGSAEADSILQAVCSGERSAC